MRYSNLAVIAALAASLASAQNNTQGLLRALNAQVLQLRGVIASGKSDQSAAHSQAADALARRQQVLAGLMAAAPARALELAFPDDVLADLAETFPEAAGTLEQHGVWQGTLYYQIEDGVGFTSHKETRKLKVGDELIDLFSPTETSAGSKCNEVVAASGVKTGTAMVVESSVVQGTGAGCSTIGAQKVAVILVQFPGPDPVGYKNTLPANVTSGFLQGVFLGNAFADANNQVSVDHSISDFWTQASDGKTWVNSSGSGALTVAGPYTLSQTYDYCNDSAALRNAAYAAANGVLDYNTFSRVVIVVPHNGSCNGIAGVGTIGCWSSECPGDGACNISWTWWRGDQIWNRDAGVMLGTHEMGHNLGLGHSGSRWHGSLVVDNIGIAGTRTEYNDTFSTMGSWNLGLYPPPHDLNQLGWMNSGNVQTVTSTGVYTIQGYDTRPAGVKALKVARGTGTTNAYYYIAYYPNNPNYLSALGGAVHNGAIIRYEDSATPGGKTDLLDFTPNAGSSTDFGDPVLPNGATWTDPFKDVQLQVTGINTANNTMTVAVTFTPPPCTPANPTVTFLTNSNTVAPGSSGGYTVRVANNDSISCSAHDFNMTANLVTPEPTIGLSYNPGPVVNVAPGATANVTLVASTTSATPVNTYTISATATSAANSSLTNTTSTNASLIVQPALPATPTGVSATAVSTGNGKNKTFQYINVSWSAAANATSYDVQRCTVTSSKGKSTCGAYLQIATGLAASPLHDNPPSGTYKYQVRAVNANGASNWSTAVQATKP